jgi:ATP-dependent Clp protease ATP-binding subunit ClpX
MADATAFLSSPMPGREIEKMLKTLITNAGNDIGRAQFGIIFIDEIDKLNKRGAGEFIQQELLKIVEGTVTHISYPNGDFPLDTNNILFICGGAFVDLSNIVRMYTGGTEMGLLSDPELLKRATPSDIAKFGLIPEFIGRLPILVFLDALDMPALVAALTKPKNAITEQYKKMFALDGIELEFEPAALDMVAKLAAKLGTGARGLRTILEERMLDIMYSVPNEKGLTRVIVTAEVIEKTGKPIFEHSNAGGDAEIPPAPVKTMRPTNAYSD